MLCYILICWWKREVARPPLELCRNGFFNRDPGSFTSLLGLLSIKLEDPSHFRHAELQNQQRQSKECYFVVSLPSLPFAYKTATFSIPS